MKNKSKSNSRRNFIGTLAAGATAGMSMMAAPLQAKLRPELFESPMVPPGASEIDANLKKIGKMEHPVTYDMSAANPWGILWANVYYITNGETGTTADKLGVVNVLRHHGIIFSFNNETVEKYKLGEVFGFNDPVTNEPTVRNPYIDPKDGDGVMPLPGLVGIKGLQEKGTYFCVCNMAYKVYSGAVAEMQGLDAETVYNDFVKGKLPGIELAPSGVWVLGRLAENGIAYIDASVG